MAGIQISGLLANQAFDWKSVVDQLIEADSIPINRLQREKTGNDDKIAALSEIYTSLESLQDYAQTIRADNPFNERTVTSTDANSTWKATSSAGAPLGNYKFEVNTLATATRLVGGSQVAQRLNATSADLSGLTMNSLPIASSITAGSFTVDGQKISFTATESLKDVLDRITSTTGVGWSYSAVDDAITLTKGAGNLVIGAANDTSNFLQALKLSNPNPAAPSTTSSGRLAVLSRTAPLASAGLAGAVTSGSFRINGVEVAYDAATDSLGTVLARIGTLDTGVTASYDAATDTVTLTNKVTGNLGVTVEDVSGGLLAALNLTNAGAVPPNAPSMGTNAKYRVNDGAWMYSATNVFDSSSHGISGLAVTVDSTGTQTLGVHSDSASMQTVVQDFITKYNDVQDLIEARTKVTNSNGKVTSAVLADNREVQDWARKLHQMVFDTVSGVTGSIKRLDDLGIDFDGTTGHLKIKDAGKLNTALTNNAADVQAYFSKNGEGLVPQMYDVLTKYLSSDTSQQERIRLQSKAIDEQITKLQARLDQERETLTNSFIRMLNAQSQAQSQNTAITNAFFKNNSNN